MGCVGAAGCPGRVEPRESRPSVGTSGARRVRPAASSSGVVVVGVLVLGPWSSAGRRAGGGLWCVREGSYPHHRARPPGTIENCRGAPRRGLPEDPPSTSPAGSHLGAFLPPRGTGCVGGGAFGMVRSLTIGVGACGVGACGVGACGTGRVGPGAWNRLAGPGPRDRAVLDDPSVEAYVASHSRSLLGSATARSWSTVCRGRRSWGGWRGGEGANEPTTHVCRRPAGTSSGSASELGWMARW